MLDFAMPLSVIVEKVPKLVAIVWITRFEGETIVCTDVCGTAGKAIFCEAFAVLAIFDLKVPLPVMVLDTN
jgi:hypothetical protein